jgi:hypothetical protein
VLIIGDMNISQRAFDIPYKFKELLLPNKLQSICFVTRKHRVTARDIIEWLENLASAKSQMHAFRGNFDIDMI